MNVNAKATIEVVSSTFKRNLFKRTPPFSFEAMIPCFKTEWGASADIKVEIVVSVRTIV